MALPDHRFQTPMSEVNPKRRVERAKNVAAGYTLSSIIKSEPQINDAIELLEKRLDELAEAGQPVEFDRWFNYLAFDVIGEVTFSRAFGFLETASDIGGSIANSRALTLYVAIAGFFLTLHNATLGNPWMGKLGLTPSQHIFDTVSRAVASRKKNTEARTDMMEHWMQAQAAHPERFGETEIQAVASATVGAGADTVSATLQAFWYYLLRSPEDLARVRAEIDKAGEEGKLSRVVSYAEARELPFLQACVRPFRDYILFPPLTWYFSDQRNI
jgi:cytochrome P450